MKAAAIALFAAIVLLSIDPAVLMLSVPPRRPRASALARRADPNPELAAFLEGVRERTARGESITIVLPAVLDRDEDANRYRGSYHLAGRDVFLARDGRRTTWIAAWRVPLDAPAVWSAHGGVLVRQR